MLALLEPTRADNQFNMTKIVKDCAPAATVPFRSVEDITKEVECVSAAIKEQQLIVEERRRRKNEDLQ